MRQTVARGVRGGVRVTDDVVGATAGVDGAREQTRAKGDGLDAEECGRRVESTSTLVSKGRFALVGRRSIGAGQLTLLSKLELAKGKDRADDTPARVQLFGRSTDGREGGAGLSVSFTARRERLWLGGGVFGRERRARGVQKPQRRRSRTLHKPWQSCPLVTCAIRAAIRVRGRCRQVVEGMEGLLPVSMARDSPLLEEVRDNGGGVERARGVARRPDLHELAEPGRVLVARRRGAAKALD